MAYLSLYRKYRSQSFHDLIGQDHVVKTLQNAIQSNRIAHAYLFTGPRGTGKTSAARLLAKALNCEQSDSAEPCNECDNCRSITEGSNLDVIEMDAASESGVEEVREKIVQIAEYGPIMCQKKVIIIDEVHDLSAKAFDALLKTIEEPPPFLIFILATTEYHKVPATIRSRCQKYEFHRGSIQNIAARLAYVAEQENFTIQPAALAAIARMADGGFRDALTLLEQAALTADGAITLETVYDQLGLIVDEMVDELLFGIKENDAKKLIQTLEKATQQGRDPRTIVESMLHRLGDLTRAGFGLHEGQDGAASAALHETAVRLGSEDMIRLRSELSTIHKLIRDISLPRLWLESELIRLGIQRQTVASPAPKPVRKAEAPATAEEPKPARKEVPAAEPPPRAAVQTKPEVPTPTETELDDFDPESATPIQLWAQTIAVLSKISANAGRKLLSTSVISLENNELQVAFSREAEYESIIHGKNAKAAMDMITDTLQKVANKPIEVKFSLRKGTVAPPDAPAVELPAEGEKLQNMVVEVMNGSNGEA